MLLVSVLASSGNRTDRWTVLLSQCHDLFVSEETVGPCWEFSHVSGLLPRLSSSCGSGEDSPPEHPVGHGMSPRGHECLVNWWP